MSGNPPENDPEILALSTDAQALLASHWLGGKRSTLQMDNQQSVLSERGAAAMRELVQADIISDEKADNGYPESRIYRLTDQGAELEFRKSFAWIEAHGNFSITQPKYPSPHQ